MKMRQNNNFYFYLISSSSVSACVNKSARVSKIDKEQNLYLSKITEIRIYGYTKKTERQKDRKTKRQKD